MSIFSSIKRQSNYLSW